MKVLVTGVAGFVGSTLAETLISRGHHVIGIDALTTYYPESIKRANINQLLQQPNFEFHEIDLSSGPLDVLIEDTSVVFHQAGQPGVRKSWGKDFNDYNDWNVLATQRLLEACTRSKTINRVVYASSSSVYGNATTYPTHETALPAPISPYGVSKLAAEHLVTLYAKNYGLPTVSLRYFTVYGPRQRPDMAFTRFVTAAQTNQPITIYGDGEQIRDFTYISDVVNANIAAGFNAGVQPGSVYNVAGGSSVTVNEVLKIVERIHGDTLDIQYVAKSLGDASRTGADTTQIQTELGWEPEVGVEKGLQRQYEWARENLHLLAASINE